LGEAVRDADVSVIEATFLDSDAAIARDYGRLTATEAAAFAVMSNVKQLVLPHIFGAMPMRNTGRTKEDVSEQPASCQSACNAVTLTVPLPVLQEIMLPPAVHEKAAATAAIGFGNVIKLLLRFKARWWINGRANGSFRPAISFIGRADYRFGGLSIRLINPC
jgi:hypothetical protein